MKTLRVFAVAVSTIGLAGAVAVPTGCAERPGKKKDDKDDKGKKDKKDEKDEDAKKKKE